ncbi:ParB N-terminal domain-containing protein [Photorhabdus luminescens]|uniref:ParB-like N-terminal domain-containing protein n=1 Tax=Photorhabdus luminescens subsp. mexicana TaxID=2100167 RepID=A0A4R4JJJ1_PHOLU|nr:ParB N-terminal domain-containing protein [Photorhabdus luminescens]TDB53972.1 hypothetical protein C5468_05395 [Photorhabdus luminescens subsp. mexicana]
MKLILEEVSNLRPTELHCPVRVEQLIKKVKFEGFWTQPIWIDEATNVVIDGHHRLELAKTLKLSCIPCLAFDYEKELLVYSRNEDKTINHSDVIKAGLDGRPLGYKQTRHEFAGNVIETQISLKMLGFVNE